MTELVITLPGASIDLVGARVLRDGQAVKVEPRAWRVLEYLARFRHRVVTKEELLAALRLKGAVSEGALRQAVRAARLAIGDDGPGSAIRTIPRIGYILDVPPASAPERPPERLSQADIPSVIIGPLRNEAGTPCLPWAAHGLAACIAHGLSIDGHGTSSRPCSRLVSYRQPSTRTEAGHVQDIQSKHKDHAAARV